MSVTSLISSGPLLLAMPVAAAAGAVTFLSPCCLPLVPGYLAYITGMSGADASGTGGAGRASSGGPAGGPAAEATAEGGTAAAAVAVTAAAGTLTVDRPGGGGTSGSGGTNGSGGSGGTNGSGGSGGSGGTTAAAANARPRPSTGRTVAGTALFVVGFSAVFSLGGGALGGLGQLFSAHDSDLTRVLGGLTILLGLLFFGAFDRFMFAGRVVKPSFMPKAGLAGAPLLGVLFGIGWSPCIGPTLTAVLSLSLSSGTAARGAFLAFIYGLGLGIPFLIVAVAFQRLVRVLNFFKRNARMVSRIGGVMIIAVGVLEVTGAWTSTVAWLHTHWFSGYSSPL